MSSSENKTALFWRATAASLGRAGALLTRASEASYRRCLNRICTSDQALLKTNATFRDIHQGRRCFVIGNGRSLRTQDLGFLNGEITFVMNAFWKHPILERWQPTYYLMSDPVIFDRSESSKEFFADLRSRVHHTTFIVPLRYKQAIEEDQLIPRESTHFVTFGPQLDNSDLETIDLTKHLPGFETIAQLALMAAIYMGCSPIYLLGLDHNWLAERTKAEFNFYEGKTLQNHPLVTGHSMYSYDADMEAMLKVWKFYRILKSIAERRGQVILNATAGGFLDVFERSDYESLFAPATSAAEG